MKTTFGPFLVTAALLIVAAFGPAHAASDPSPSPSPTPVPTASAVSDPCGSILSIVTRPTVTTGVCTVRLGHALAENGYTNTTTTGIGGGNTAAYPQSYLRVGTGTHTEFDLTPPSYNRSTLGGAGINGSSDTAFGIKREFGYSAKALWGGNVQVSVPSGSAAFSAGGTQYLANLNGGYTLSPVFSLSATLGYGRFAGFDVNGVNQRYYAFIPSVVLVGALSSSSQLFGEYASFSSAGPGLGAKSLIDFGFQHVVSPHLQVDVEYGIQPNTINGQRLHYLGAGLSVMN